MSTSYQRITSSTYGHIYPVYLSNGELYHYSFAYTVNYTKEDTDNQDWIGVNRRVEKEVRELMDELSKTKLFLRLLEVKAENESSSRWGRSNNAI